MALTLTTPPAAEVVSIPEAKAQLRVDFAADDEDAILARLIATATAHLDGRAGLLGRALAPQTWTWSGRIPDTGRVVLPLAPVLSIASVAVNGNALEPSDYELTDADNGEVDLDGYACAPAVIVFQAGYADAKIPEPLKHAILLLVSHWFEHREEFTEIEGSARSIPYGVRALTNAYRRVAP